MLFHSYEFLFVFFPLALLGYGISRRIAVKEERDNRIKNLPGFFLLLASLAFYGFGGIGHLSLLLISMAVNYGLGIWMKRDARPMRILAVGLVFHLGVLCGFKYLAGGRYLPPALSFYTFTQIAFLAECYRGNVRDIHALSYGLYVAYFPKMMQGPIALPGELLPKIQEISGASGASDVSDKTDKTGKTGRASGAGTSSQADWERIFRCLYLFVLGLFKKVLIADTFGSAVNLGYGALGGLNSWDGVIVMLSYTLQLYFDFSGYCDMAMGISGLFGIELPLNFNAPYQAANILEFWKRWHMTLTGFFTRYVYIPLGGNRKGRARTYLNVLLVFFLSGIWHGTGVQFLIWGMLHGVLYVVTRGGMESGFWKRIVKSCEKIPALGKQIAHGVCVLATFLYVNVAWVFFRAPSVQEAVTLLKTITAGKGGRWSWELAGCFNLDEFWYVIKVLHLDTWQYAHYICMALILAGALILVFFGRTAVSFVRSARPKLIHGLIMAVLFVWSVLSLSGVSSFLYVNF